MSYTIKFTGDIEPMIVSDSSGKQLSDLLEKKMAPEYLTSGGRTVKTARIVSVEPQTAENRFNAKSQERKLDSAEEEKTWRAAWKKRQALPPTERAAAQEELVKHLWWGMTTQKEIPEDVLPKIMERCAQYFVENPMLTCANPTCYKDLVMPHFRDDARPRIEKNDGVQRIDRVLRAASLNFVERVLIRDLNFSRKVVKYGFDNVRL